MRTEKVQIPDKMKKKMDKIVKALKKSVGAHAKQAKTIGKMTSMDKPDVSNIEEKHGGDHMSTGRKMSDSEMKKREDIKKGLMKSKSDFKDRYGKDADKVATEPMRTVLQDSEIHSRVVIGEGERDDATMLYIGEEMGNSNSSLKIDIDVDPLECTKHFSND